MARSRRTGVLFGTVWLVSAATLLACNGLLGLDDFQAVECTGGRCDGGLDATPNGDGAADAAVDALGTAPVSWAQWRMPNYPQTPNGPSENPAHYTPALDGYRDDVSKLVWREPSVRGGKSFADAKASCPTGWRLPSRIELVTLLDLSRAPTIDTTTFPTTESASYWTASEVRPYGVPTRKRWVVDFSSGNVSQAEETGSASVRCIKDQP